MTEFEEIIVELSYNCNLSCSMCGFGKEVNPYSKSKFLTFENYKNILHQIGDKTKTIRLNGRGESTIHPDFVEILNYTKEKYPSVNINLFSNFSFNNKRILDALIKNQVQLFISMDSSEADELTAIRKGARFQYIEENIKRLSDLPNRPFIIFTIQETNIHRIYDIAKFAYDNNCQMLFNTIRRAIYRNCERAKSKHFRTIRKSNRVIFYLNFTMLVSRPTCRNTIKSNQTNSDTRNNAKLSCVG